jgi:hypothetical protein
MVVAFGTMFNDLQLVRYNKDGTLEIERILIPIIYGQKEKFISRLAGDPNLVRSVQALLPRMSFQVEGISYDPTRKRNNYIYKSKEVPGDSSSVRRQFEGVPYDINFKLSIYVRNTEDGCQIVEQILPIFRPDYTLTVQFDDIMNSKIDVPIILNSVNYDAEQGETEDDQRILTWELDFTMKSWFLAPIEKTAVIKKANTFIYDASTQQASIVALNMGPAEANSAVFYKIDEDVYQGSSFGSADVRAKVVGWSNTANVLYVTTITNRFGGAAKFSSNVEVVGVDSRAYRNLLSYYNTQFPLLAGYVKPNPYSANSNSAYTYTEQVVEFPNIL